MHHYKIYRFKSLASTQDKAKEFAGKGLSNTILIAGAQTKGIKSNGGQDYGG